MEVKFNNITETSPEIGDVVFVKQGDGDRSPIYCKTCRDDDGLYFIPYLNRFVKIPISNITHWCKLSLTYKKD